MDDDRFFELREQLVSLLNSFVSECEKLDIDYKEEIDVILSEIESS